MMMRTMRGAGLLGLASRVAGTKGFSTEIFATKVVGHDSRLLLAVKLIEYERQELSFYTTEEELKNIFSPFGAIEEARLMRDNQTGRPKGFGFVKYSSQVAAEKAVKAMDGRIIRGRIIFVETAKEHDTG